MSKIVRNCSMCGEKIKINLDTKRYYDNGNYFGKIKIPIEGTGKNIKIGTDKIDKHKLGIFKWTGKYKKVEHWECNKCFKKMQSE